MEALEQIRTAGIRVPERRVAHATPPDASGFDGAHRLHWLELAYQTEVLELWPEDQRTDGSGT